MADATAATSGSRDAESSSASGRESILLRRYVPPPHDDTGKKESKREGDSNVASQSLSVSHQLH
eukprot:6198436-Pleurochrysis_carterae.AAC.2